MSAQAFPRSSSGDLYLSIAIVTVVVLLLGVTSPAHRHWFLLPVALCGALMLEDALGWLRGRLELFDPAGIVGLLGVHHFFVAPLLHVHWDKWMGYVVQPDDWRTWLGGMGILNGLGLLVYRAVRARCAKPRQIAQPTSHRFSSPFLPALLFLLLISALTQVWVYDSMGGISGYISAFEDRAGFDGKGLIFMISESFPILLVFGYVWVRRGSKGKEALALVVVLLVAFLVLKLFFGGLRGSRSNTVWGLFWAVGIVHLFVRPITRKHVLAGLVFLIGFMYVYGFFKAGGLEGLKTLSEGREAALELEERTGRTIETVLLGDLARADVQAYILYQTWRPSSDHSYAYGSTYLAPLSALLPESLLERPFASKAVVGTDLLYGPGTYHSGGLASQVYGLAGEAMLNFGALAVPFSFILLGWAVGRVQRFGSEAHPDDVRLLLFPFLVNLCFVIVVGDFANLFFFFFKNGSVPLALILIASTRVALPDPAPVGESISRDPLPESTPNGGPSCPS